jgi:hypothetical protein
MHLRSFLSQLNFKKIIVLIVTVQCIILTSSLGMWQWSRAKQKWALEESIEQMKAMPSLSQEAYLALDNPLDALHRTVLLKGTWLFKDTVFLDNRPLNAQAGFWVMTPLKLSDERSVLVQRGWIPRNANVRTELPPFETPLGEQEIVARISEGPSKMFDLGSSAPEDFKSLEAARSLNIRQNIESLSFAKERGLSIVGNVIQIGSNSEGLRREWPLPASTAYKNVGYTVQWFALSLLLVALYCWYQIIKPQA